MSFYHLGPERKIAPPEYQDHINAIGGFNRFGDPNFRVVWGETATDVVYGTDASGRRGQHVILKHGGIPSWFIEVWKPPECFGTPEMWYALSWDPETGKHQLGEYPWRGLYMPASFNLYVKKIIPGVPMYDSEAKGMRIVGERLVFEAMPLNHYIIDLLIPNIIKAMDETFLQKKIALENRIAFEKQKAAMMAEAMYLDANPAWGGAASSKESNREAQMERIARNMKISAEQIKKKLGTGHKVH